MSRSVAHTSICPSFSYSFLREIFARYLLGFRADNENQNARRTRDEIRAYTQLEFMFSRSAFKLSRDCCCSFCRMFGNKRCARCQAAILASELVMRARELVFHVRCFSCAACSVPLTKGDHFGMRDGAVLCRLHYEMGAELHPSQSPPVPVYPPGPQHYPSQPFPSPEFLPHHHHHHHHPHAPHPHLAMHPHQHPSHVSPVPLQPTTPSGPDAASSPKVPYFNGAASGVPPPRQKGRPRKRKPKDLEAMTASLGNDLFIYILICTYCNIQVPWLGLGFYKLSSQIAHSFSCISWGFF